MDTKAAIAACGHLELIREPELSDVCSSPPGWGLAEVYELDRPAAGGLGGVSDHPGFVSAASRPPGTSRIRLRSAFHRAIATTWREGLAPPSIPRVSRPTSASVAHHRR